MKLTLRAARVNAGLTQTEAASALGVARETVSRWEKSGKAPRKWALKLCALYQADIGMIADAFER